MISPSIPVRWISPQVCLVDPGDSHRCCNGSPSDRVSRHAATAGARTRAGDASPDLAVRGAGAAGAKFPMVVAE